MESLCCDDLVEETEAEGVVEGGRVEGEELVVVLDEIVEADALDGEQRVGVGVAEGVQRVLQRERAHQRDLREPAELRDAEDAAHDEEREQDVGGERGLRVAVGNRSRRSRRSRRRRRGRRVCR